MTDKIKDELEMEIETENVSSDWIYNNFDLLKAKLSQHLATKQAMIKEFEKMIDEFDISHFTCKFCKGKHGDDDWSCYTYEHELELKKELKQKLGELK